MCGIAAAVALQSGGADLAEITGRMVRALEHRGPDGSGVRSFRGAALAACRLAIVGPGPAGGQPMGSPSRRYWLAYNGELYDHVELRAAERARGARLRTSTDTELMLLQLTGRGADALNGLDAMFAFALWDDQRRRLLAGRDRFGEKPLFYVVWRDMLLLASEPVAFAAAGVDLRFNTATWPELLLHGHVAGAATPYAGLRRVLPGHVLSVEDGVVSHECWADPATPSAAGQADLLELLDASVQRRLRADAPVGVLLSGGLDSSTVAALAARQHGPGLPAFTVRFPGEPQDEGRFARAVARRSGLDLHEVSVPLEHLPELLEDATRAMGEPVFHVTGHLMALARLAADQVRVLLAGEGADELFGGYSRYHDSALRLGTWLRPVVALWRHVPDRVRMRRTQLARLSGLPRQLWPLGFGRPHPDVIDLAAGSGPWRRATAALAVAAATAPTRQLMAYEQDTWLPMLLAHSDRATMAASIECRQPFLAPQVVACAAALPVSALRDRHGVKAALRQAATPLLPPEVVARPKQGFMAPLPRYGRSNPRLRHWIRSLPELEVVRSVPLPSDVLGDMIGAYLDGDDHAGRLVWRIAAVALWHSLCVEGRPHEIA